MCYFMIGFPSDTDWEVKVSQCRPSIPAGVRWFGVDPGGLHPCGPSQPSGLGDVRLGLLLRHDLPLDDHVRSRVSQEQLWLGGRCKT